jgi:hypothetical protein
MKKLLLILLCVPLMFSCGEKQEENDTDNLDREITHKKNSSETEYVTIDPTLDKDDGFEDLENSSTITPTRDTIKLISSVRDIKEECDCVHFANNILYGNFQYLDMISTKEQFEEFSEDVQNSFWFGDNVDYCVNAFNSDGYMGQNPDLDIDVIITLNNPEYTYKQYIDQLISALPYCPGVSIWNELSEQFENKFSDVSKKYQ